MKIVGDKTEQLGTIQLEPENKLDFLSLQYNSFHNFYTQELKIIFLLQGVQMQI